jgi:hypothetical protein
VYYSTQPDAWNKLEVVFNGEKNSLIARNLDLTGGVISEGSTAVQSKPLSKLGNHETLCGCELQNLLTKIL